LVFGWTAVVLAIAGQSRLENDGFLQAGIFFGVGLVIFIALFRRASLDEAPKASAGPDLGDGAPTVTRAAVALSSTVILAVLAAVRFDVDAPRASDWWLHASSLVLLVFIAGYVDGRRPVRAVAPSRWLYGAGLLLLLVPASFMRLFRLAELPFGTWYDEAEAGLVALRVMEAPGVHSLFVYSINATLHYVHLIVLSFHTFGVDTEAIRYVSVIMGVGTVLAAYWVGAQLFSRPMGLVFAFLMAVSRWSVTFSRIGMYNISTPLFQLLSLGFLLRAMRTGRLLDFVLAGLCIGLGLNFYAAFQLFLIVVAFFVMLRAFEDRSFLARSWRGLLLMVVTAVITVTPVARFAVESPDDFFERTRTTSILANKTPAELPSALIGNGYKHALMFNYRGDRTGRHNLYGEPMLDPVSAALMILGLGLCLSRLPRPGSLRLPFWLGVGLLGGILSLDFEAPQSLRSIGALPAAYLLAVVPLHELWERARRSGGGHKLLLGSVPLITLLSLAVASNYHTYFHRQANDAFSWTAHSTPETITAGLLNRKPPDAVAYVTTFHYGHPTLGFLARDAGDYRRFETYDWLPFREPADRDVVLILNHDGRGQFDEARRLYPNAQFEEIRPPTGVGPIVYHAYLSRKNLAAIQGLIGSYTSLRSHGEVLTRQDASLNFDWADGRACFPSARTACTESPSRHRTGPSCTSVDNASWREPASRPRGWSYPRGITGCDYWPTEVTESFVFPGSPPGVRCPSYHHGRCMFLP
jgi:4-amino-4-deoxy-L-arabinose transferase-like glycosyltransferase